MLHVQGSKGNKCFMYIWSGIVPSGIQQPGSQLCLSDKCSIYLPTLGPLPYLGLPSLAGPGLRGDPSPRMGLFGPHSVDLCCVVLLSFLQINLGEDNFLLNLSKAGTWKARGSFKHQRWTLYLRPMFLICYLPSSWEEGGFQTELQAPEVPLTLLGSRTGDRIWTSLLGPGLSICLSLRAKLVQIYPFTTVLVRGQTLWSEDCVYSGHFWILGCGGHSVLFYFMCVFYTNMGG
jgi:hypothetical protein